MMLREAKRVQVRGDILRVCEKMFRARGFDRTSIDDIAAAAGISRQTFFNYFPGKDGVVSELAVEWLQRQGELPKLDGGAGKKSVLAGARAYVAMQARAIETDRKFMALVIAHAGPFAAAGGIEARGRQAELGRSIFTGVADVLRAGQASGEVRADIDPERAAEVYVSAMLMTVRLWLSGEGWKQEGLEARLNAVIDVLEGGLKAPRRR